MNSEIITLIKVAIEAAEVDLSLDTGADRKKAVMAVVESVVHDETYRVFISEFIDSAVGMSKGLIKLDINNRKKLCCI